MIITTTTTTAEHSGPRVYVRDLPPLARLSIIAMHRKCFPELWAFIPESVIVEELYNTDLVALTQENKET